MTPDVAKAFLRDHNIVFGYRCEEHKACRLGGGVAAWAGDAGDGDSEVTWMTVANARHHGPRHLRTDRSVCVDEGGGHSKKRGLGGTGVGDVAAVDDIGGSGNRRQ